MQRTCPTRLERKSFACISTCGQTEVLKYENLQAHLFALHHRPQWGQPLNLKEHIKYIKTILGQSWLKSVQQFKRSCFKWKNSQTSDMHHSKLDEKGEKFKCRNIISMIRVFHCKFMTNIYLHQDIILSIYIFHVHNYELLEGYALLNNTHYPNKITCTLMFVMKEILIHNGVL